MIPLVKLKKEVEFNQELKHIVDALKGIAMSRFHILQRQLQVFEEFPQVAARFLRGMDLEHIDHPYVRSASQRNALICITSDGGFLGGLNTKVVSAGLAEAGRDALVTVVGERGGTFLREQKFEFHQLPGVTDNTRYKLAMEIRQHVLPQILDGKCGKLFVVYPHPVSLAVQTVTLETLLPCQDWVKTDGTETLSEDILWESDPKDVLSYVVTFWIEHRISEILALSRVAELGARVMHLEGSYQELERLGKTLKRQYHRSRHEIIDRSMREVFASQLLFVNITEEDEACDE